MYVMLQKLLVVGVETEGRDTLRYYISNHRDLFIEGHLSAILNTGHVVDLSTYPNCSLDDQEFLHRGLFFGELIEGRGGINPERLILKLLSKV